MRRQIDSDRPGKRVGSAGDRMQITALCMARALLEEALDLSLAAAATRS